MTDATQQQALDLLSTLAAKLGQTVEALWPTAVRYVAVSAAVNVGIGLIVVVGLLIGMVRLWKYSNQTNDRYSDDFEFKVAAGCCLVVAILVAFVVVGFELPTLLEPTGYLVTKAIGAVSK